MTHRSQTRVDSGWNVGIAALATLLALVLGLVMLASKSLWFDEAYAYWHAKASLPRLYEIVTTGDASMPLYFYFLHFWVPFGDTEFILRLPSVLFGAAAIPFVMAIGNRLLGRPWGSVAGFLLVANSFFVRYEQEARGYALLVFLVALSTYALIRMLDVAGAWAWIYVAAASLTVMTHAFGCLVIGTHVVVAASAFPFPEGPRAYVDRYRTGVLGGGLVILAAASTVILPLIRITRRGGYASLPKIDPSFLYTALRQIGGGNVVAAALLFLCAVIGAASLSRSLGEEHTKARFGRLLCLGLFLLPLVVPLLVSITIRPIVNIRYLIVALPGLVLVAAHGLSKIATPVIRSSALAALGLSLAFGVAHWYSSSNEDWRTATSVVLEGSQPGDGLIVYQAESFQPFAYYASRSPSANIQGALMPPLRFEEATQYSATLPFGAVIQSAADHPRVWLVLSHDFNDRERSKLISHLLSRFEQTAEHDFLEVSVQLFERT